jgi:hypothetical protein
MPGLKHEKLCLAPVAGVDEAGRGPLAGPVVAAAVILPARGVPRGIDDSKKLSAKERERLAQRLQGCAIVGVGIVEPDEIDRLNIYWATMKAMTLAVDAPALGPCLHADRKGRRDQPVDRRGIDHRQDHARRDHDRRGRDLAGVPLAFEQGLWLRPPPARAARTRPFAAASPVVRAGRPCRIAVIHA